MHPISLSKFKITHQNIPFLLETSYSRKEIYWNSFISRMIIIDNHLIFLYSVEHFHPLILLNFEKARFKAGRTVHMGIKHVSNKVIGVGGAPPLGACYCFYASGSLMKIVQRKQSFVKTGKTI